MDSLRDDAFTASNSLNVSTRSFNSRFNARTRSGNIGGWIANAERGDSVWIQADLGAAKFVRGVATQAVDGADDIFVTSFSLQCGLQRRGLQDIIDIVTEAKQIFSAGALPFENLFFPHYCRRIRLLPIEWTIAAGLRWNIYGCKSKQAL